MREMADGEVGEGSRPRPATKGFEMATILAATGAGHDIIGVIIGVAVGGYVGYWIGRQHAAERSHDNDE